MVRSDGIVERGLPSRDSILLFARGIVDQRSCVLSLEPILNDMLTSTRMR